MLDFRIKNWTLIRKLQLGMGLFCLGDFLFFSQEGTVLVLGIVLLAQAITNFQLGCASGACVRKDMGEVKGIK